MLTNELNQLQEELQYHRNSIQELEERITEVKVYDGYAAQATEAVEDAIKQIGMGKYLWLFKEHILSMFPEQPPAYLEDEVEEEINLVPLTEVHGTEVPQEVEKIKSEKSYYELTGKPDLRPTTYKDLTPNITYSSDGRAYAGFNDYSEAEKFRDSISQPAMIDEAVIMNGFKYEVKFHCSKEYIQELSNSINSMSDDSSFEEINPRVLYNHHDKTVYLGMTAKNRCDYYGQYLTGQLTVGKKYTYSNKPSFINGEEYKYELRITEIELDDAVHLANFNLQRNPEHPDNAKLLTDWRANKVRELPPAYTPSPKPTPLKEVQVGDIVAIDATKIKEKQYKVLEIFEGHCEVICCHNTEMSKMINERYHFKEVYKVASEDIQVDDRFNDPTLIQVHPVPVKKSDELSKQREGLTTEDFVASSEKLCFAAPPYNKISLDEIEVCDIVSTGKYVKAYYEVYQHNGSHLLARCLHHDSLPMRIGQDGYYIAAPFLVEKADTSEIMAAA